MSGPALAYLITSTYVVDTVVELLYGEVDGGNSDEQAHKGGDGPYYFHPIGHNEG